MDTAMFGDQAARTLDGLLALPEGYEISGVLILVALDSPEGDSCRIYSSVGRAWEQEGLLREGIRTVHEGDAFEDDDPAEPPL